MVGTHVNFDTQVIYKLGAIEAEVKSLGEMLTTAVKRLEDKIDENTDHNNERVKELTERVSRNEQRLNDLDDWKKSQVSRVAAVVAIMSLFWLVFGTVLQDKMSSMF